MRIVRECTKANNIRNKTIRSDLNIFLIYDKIQENKTKWKDHAIELYKINYNTR